MPESEFTERIFFLIFFAFFILGGAYPFWKKLSVLLRKAGRSAENGRSEAGFFSATDNSSRRLPANIQLHDFEYFVFRQLALANRAKLTGRQINSNLHLEMPQLKSALRALHKKGLLDMDISALFKRCYSLSKIGTQYALEQDLITQPQNPNG